MARVVLRGVNKSFGGVHAVCDFNLEVADGEFVVLVGPSGCGKTTTLRMIAGLELPTSGEIFIGDRFVNDLPPKDRDVAMVFQNYALYPHMDVYENMAFGLRVRRLPRSEIDRRVRSAASLLGLQDLLHRKPRELSGGQRQRVALGRAIVRNPSVFLMDEPLSNLDAQLRVQMRAELIKIHDEVRATTVYVTHDQVEAMTMGHRIVVMKDGMIQQVATPQEVYTLPANVFVARFIGSPPMNLLSGCLREEGGSFWFESGEFRLPIPWCQVALRGGSRDVLLGVRPEHVRVHGGSDPHPTGVRLRGTVEVVESLGSEAYVHVALGASRLVARSSWSEAPRRGDTVTVFVDVERGHLFDAATGMRVEGAGAPTQNQVPLA